MCGFWKGTPEVFKVNLAVDLKGGFAKFNFSALRLPGRKQTESKLFVSNKIPFCKSIWK